MDHKQVLTREDQSVGFLNLGSLPKQGDTLEKWALSSLGHSNSPGERVLECLFDEELGIHAKLCLIFSRRGVLPKKLFFSAPDSLGTHPSRFGEREGARHQRGDFNNAQYGTLYATFQGTPEQADSILRELKKTVGVLSARLETF
jgi:hypothetical protein